MSNDMPAVIFLPPAVSERHVDHWNMCPSEDTTLKRLALFK